MRKARYESIEAPIRHCPAGAFKKRRAHRPVTLVWGLALWLAIAGNLPLWQRLYEPALPFGRRFLFLAAIASMLIGAIAVLLWLTAWPRLFRPLASLLVLVAALESHFMWRYRVVVDSTMLANVLGTDLREARDLMSWSLPATLLAIGGPALWWIWHRPMPALPWLRRTGSNLAGALVALALVAASALLNFQELASLARNHKPLRYMVNPLNAVYAGGRLLAERLPAEAKALEPVGRDAVPGTSYASQARPPLLLLVVGETARARNWGLNGYARPTTPLLAHWQAEGDLFNFSRVRSCGTNTQVSVPCMFSPLTRAQGGDRPAVHENLLDVLQRAGLAVMWIDNQAGCKGVCARIPAVSTANATLPGLCEAGECFDEAMLAGLDERMAALEPGRRARGVVLVMHQMGSHGPAYHRRSPPDRKPFQPECTSSRLSDCPAGQLMNAYDNTIVATDRFLDAALRWLKSRSDAGTHDTALVYLSDHGESLGEDGLYLHGIPYSIAPSEQTHVPMIAWMSPGMRERRAISADCLRKRAAEPLSHDHLFHSVLGLMDIRTNSYLSTLDLFAPCSRAGFA